MTFTKSMLKAAVLFAGIALSATPVLADVNAKPFTVPEVASWKGGLGRFIPGPTTRIVTD